MAVKKPNTTRLIELNAKYEIARYFWIKKMDQEISKDELFNKINKLFWRKYSKKDILEMNDKDTEYQEKYHKDMFDFGISKLKKDSFLSIIDKKIISFEYSEPSSVEFIDTSNISWDTEQTISKIYTFVNSRKHLIPSFQRSTAWTRAKDYIELAFSIFKSVPLGLMYFYEIPKKKAIEIGHKKIKKEIDSKRPSSGFEEVSINEMNSEKIMSIIDGQQRITGINIIVAGKLNGKKMYFNERNIGIKKFSFKKGEDYNWVSIEKIYSKLKRLKDKGNIPTEMDFQKIGDELFLTIDSLKNFYNGFFEAKMVVICKFPSVELEQILQLFIRTNNFGKKLNASDIMKSMLVGQNKKLRNHMDIILGIIEKDISVFKESNLLKLLTVIFTGNTKINYSNFSKENDNHNHQYENINLDIDDPKSWSMLEKAIKSFHNILKSSDQFDSSLIISANSIIPVLNWIVKYNEGKNVHDQGVINNIIKYLIWSNTTKFFGSSTDQKLLSLINKKTDYNFEEWKKVMGHDVYIQNFTSHLKELDYTKYRNMIQLILLYSKVLDLKIPNPSIEHMIARANGGSDLIHNLSILPKDINSAIGKKTLHEKVEYICKEFDVAKDKVLEYMLITNEDIENNRIDRDVRLKKIAKIFIDKIHHL